MSDSSKPITIAWLTVGDEGYGVGRAVVIQAEGVRRLGWRAVMVCLDEGALADDCESRGMQVHRLRLGKPPLLSGSLGQKPRQLWRLRRYNRRAMGEILEVLKLKREHADVLHVLWPNLVGLAGAVARRAGIPCFWEMPNRIGDRYPFGLNRRLYQWTCRRYGIRVLANSAYTAATLGDHPVQPTVFYLSADETVFDPDRVEAVSRAELGIPDDAVVLGICARLSSDKGQDRVLEAILRLDTVATGRMHLLLLGGPTDGSYADQLRRMAQAHGAGDRLHLAGAVADPQRWYPVMDIVVNNYLGAEAFGLSVVEGMMMGRPALVHALGGPAETVVDGRTGWHIPAPTVEAVRAGLERALSEREKWAAMGQAARQYALTHFSSMVQAHRYRELAQRALGSGGAKK